MCAYVCVCACDVHIFCSRTFFFWMGVTIVYTNSMSAKEGTNRYFRPVTIISAVLYMISLGIVFSPTELTKLGIEKHDCRCVVWG